MQLLWPARRSRQILVIDNYDSFTYNLVQLLGMLGAHAVVLHNDAPELPRTPQDLTPYAGMLISPGPSSPNRSGRCLDLLKLGAFRLPILGVCLGHQAIALHFGARIESSARPWHGKTTRIWHQGRGIFRTIPDGFRAARYNSLTVSAAQLPPCLEMTAQDEHGEIMAFRHRNLRIEGVQFHPESILSEHGEPLLANWLQPGLELEARALKPPDLEQE